MDRLAGMSGYHNGRDVLFRPIQRLSFVEQLGLVVRRTALALFRGASKQLLLYRCFCVREAVRAQPVGRTSGFQGHLMCVAHGVVCHD